MTIEVNEVTGYREGSLKNTIAHELLAGGKSRADITARLRRKLGKRKGGLTTRNGADVNLPVYVGAVLKDLRARGAKVEESYVVVPKVKAKRKRK